MRELRINRQPAICIEKNDHEVVNGVDEKMEASLAESARKLFKQICWIKIACRD